MILDLIEAIRAQIFSKEEGMWERISIQKEHLSRLVSLPVYLDTEKPANCPALIISTNPLSNILAWIIVRCEDDTEDWGDP